MPETASRISREELLEKIQRGETPNLFEVLPRMYWRKHHLPGARSLPLDELESALPALVPDKRAEIIVYCWDFT